mgnify:CR=1 FL=1
MSRSRLLDVDRSAVVVIDLQGKLMEMAWRSELVLAATRRLMKLAAIFGPQHGFNSDLQDNMIETPHGRDRRRGVPVHSLYSETREPAAAVWMAEAYGRLMRKPGVAMVTAGPGFTNALTGLVNANQENAPLVLISGVSPIQDSDKGALQEMNQADMIKSTVKWYGICRDITRIPEYLFNAFRQANSGRPGPVR